MKAGYDMYTGKNQPMTAKGNAEQKFWRGFQGQSLELVTFSKKQAELLKQFSLWHIAG